MLLSTPEQIENYTTSGLWGEDRLDLVFARHAEQRADDLALIDDQSLHSVSGRRPQCLSFIRTWRRVVAVSEFLTGIGMKSDTVVAMLIPPSSDAAVLALVASRMGIILAPIPLTSGEADLREKLEQVGAKAIVCCSHYEDEPVAERVRNVAADMFSIRFVFCIGENAPEGLIDLGEILDQEDNVDEESLFQHSRQIGANVVLAIHWSAAGSDVAQPIGRSHNQLLAIGRYVHEQTVLQAENCLFVTHHMSGLVGFAVGLVGALDIGARIQFHNFRTTHGFVEALAEFGGQHVSLPGSLWQGAHDLLPMNVREQLISVSLVWNRAHAEQSVYGENETAARLIDLTNFKDLVLFSQLRRHPSEVGSIPLGSINSLIDPAKVWMETFLFGMEEARKAQPDAAIIGGELCVRGAMLPECAFPLAGAIEGKALRATEDGFIHTEIGCHLVTEEHGEQRALFRPLGDLGDVLSFGGFAERGEDLDSLYRECIVVSDAAAFIVPSEDEGPAHLMAALVVDDKDIAREEFYAFLKNKRVSRMKWPRDIIFVEAIPRRTNGKVMRESLIEASQVADVA
ncbi:class I adenylate-forming enzyme family protein [uncultured Cohaesibacter sp.]|uniref:class I adenylate-forming enzyme family protein n=1 Tax=uncultured Cohaesibacter sp. TaxID=1002546 RepID=UPI0029C93366|nr:class I adenylate-forming enzyme family protein [uncultured Cohaesibacter sp.]